MERKLKGSLDSASFWLRGDPGRNATYDAIVVGSGAAGGVAAWRLCSLGLKVLVLEAGQLPENVHRPLTAAVSAAMNALLNSGIDNRLSPTVLRVCEKALRLAGRIRQPVQSRCFAWALSPQCLVDDVDCPYISDSEEPFHWYRSRQPGGRMLVPGHGRQYYRLGGMDGQASKAGLPVWPFDSMELDPSYRIIERTLGLRGGEDSVNSIPGRELSEALPLSSAEKKIISTLKNRWPGAKPILGHYAPPAAWLDLAAATGRLRGRAGAVVRQVLYSASGAAEGVEWFDCGTGQIETASAPIVFLCASAIESTRILMLSAGGTKAEAVGMHSPALGRYLMDHAVMSAVGYSNSLPDLAGQSVEPGRCIYVPPLDEEGGPFGIQVHIHPRSASNARVDIVSFADVLPDAENRVLLELTRTDAYGVPVPRIRFRYSDAQRAIGRRQSEIIQQISEDLGLDHLSQTRKLAAPGTGIHECGTARMGSDPATSVVDPHNECWDVKGLYVTDGACFPRVDVHNPTLTIMALTARAADHAVSAASRRTSEQAGSTTRFSLQSRPSRDQDSGVPG
ncbi:MAG: FAD-binding protein [Hyphomonas sp.]|nr:FAD-binding protein [Hyphomonas sp.]